MKLALATAFVFLASGLPGAWACVGCRQPGVTGPDEPQTVMAGVAFSWSVITLLLMVVLVLGGLSIYIARTCQRLDREKNAS